MVANKLNNAPLIPKGAAEGFLFTIPNGLIVLGVCFAVSLLIVIIVTRRHENKCDQISDPTNDTVQHAFTSLQASGETILAHERKSMQRFKNVSAPLLIALLLLFGLSAQAQLTISSASVDSTGKILTLNIAGNTGALSFPGGVASGMYPRLTYSGTVWDLPPGTATISGTTVTFAMGGIVPQGATSCIAIASGFNLTDTASATVANGNYTFVNNSTQVGTVISFSASSVGLSAYWVFNPGTPNYLKFSHSGLTATPATMDFVVNCTALTLSVQSNMGVAVLTASVDNGGYSNLPFTTLGDPSIITVASGLAAGNHSFSIAYLAQNPQIDTDIMAIAYGGTGGLSPPRSTTSPAPSFWSTTYPASGTLNQYTMMAASQVPASYITLETGTTTGSDTAQGWVLNGANVYPKGINGPSFSFTISGPPTTAKLYVSETGAAIDVRVDGVSVGHVVVPNTANSSQFVDITSLLSGISAGSHAIVCTIVGYNSAPYIGSIYLVGATVLGTPPAARDHWVFYGDSIVAGPYTTSVANNGSVGFLQTWAHMVASANNVAYSNRGISGSAVHYFGGTGETPNTNGGEHRATDVSNCNHVPKKVIILYGDNDVRQVVTLGAARPHTTTTAAIVATGAQSVAVSSTSGFLTGQTVQVDVGAADPASPGASYEAVSITVVDGTHLSGTFTKTHASGITISRPEMVGEYQTSVFNMLNTIVSNTPSTTKVYYLSILPVADPGNASTYGLTASGISCNVGAANLALWNQAIQNAIAPSGAGNGNGSGTYLTSGQAARITYLNTLPWGLNGTTNPNYDVSNNTTGTPTGTQTNYTTYYVAGNIHPNDAGNSLPNITNLGNGLIAQHLLSSLTPPPLFRRGAGGRAGSRSSDVTINRYGVSPLIIAQLTEEVAATR